MVVPAPASGSGSGAYTRGLVAAFGFVDQVFRDRGNRSSWRPVCSVLQGVFYRRIRWFKFAGLLSDRDKVSGFSVRAVSFGVWLNWLGVLD